MSRLFHRRMSIMRFLVAAEEVAIEVLEQHEALAKVSNGAVTRQTAEEIRERVAAVRRLQQAPREVLAPTASVLVIDACGRMARVRQVARDVALLRGDEQLRARLDQLQRDNPLRARAVSVVACSLEAYAGIVREHAADLTGVIDVATAAHFERLARDLRTSSAQHRHADLRRRARHAERDRLLAEIEVRLREVRAAQRVR